MSHYFLAGNLWAALAVIAFVGRTWERDGPTRYSFFGGGRYFSTGGYASLIAGRALAAAFCFYLWARSHGYGTSKGMTRGGDKP